MEKILLSFDEAGFNGAQRKIGFAQSDAQKIVDKINEICSFRMDNAGFMDILHSQGESVANRIRNAVNNELATAKISSESIRSAAVKGDLEKYWSVVKSYVLPEGQIRHFLSLDEEGKVVCSDKQLEKLREEFSHYIQTEKGLEILAAHKKMVKAINEFTATTPAIRAMTLIQYVDIDAEANKVHLTPLDYDRIAAFK